jgi:signal transduction histidine kinase
MEQRIRVLLIEDNPGDARLIQELLSEAGLFSLDTVDRLDLGLKSLSQKTPDVLLLDLSLPDSHGFQTFLQVHTHAPMVPLVVLSGLVDESLALEAVRKGAQDYLVKGRVDGQMLSRVMRYAIERKGTEERLKQANERLKKLDELKSNFISAASHELRTPLTAIKGYVAIVLQERVGKLNDQQKEFLGYVKDSTDRLHRLLDDLLDLSRIESGRVEMRMTLTDLNLLLKEEVMIFKVQADNKGILIESEIEPSLKKIYCDADKVREVMDNLISNSIKYTPKNGKIKVSARNEGNRVYIEVRDNGIGIKEEDQMRVFEPFQRINRDETEDEEGVGLGLALVKRIIEAHGGVIEVKSTEGKGSVFAIRLPVEKRGERQG